MKTLFDVQFNTVFFVTELVNYKVQRSIHSVLDEVDLTIDRQLCWPAHREEVIYQ